MALRRFSLLVLGGILLQSCAKGPPIQEKKLVEIYVQLQLIDARHGSEPVIQKQKIDSLLDSFDVNKAMVDSTLAWYRTDPERWRTFFDDVQARMSQIKSGRR